MAGAGPRALASPVTDYWPGTAGTLLLLPFFPARPFNYTVISQATK